MKSRVRVLNTRISASELASLGAGPLVLVPAPGSNKGLIYIDAVASVKLHGDAAFDVGDCQIGYPDAAADDLLSSSLFASYVADSEVVHFAPALALAGRLIAIDKVENQPLVLHQVAASVIPGSVATHSLGAGGADYVVGNVLTIAGGATFTVATVNAGVILTYTLTNPGTTVEVGNGQAATGGAGTGATFNVTAIDASSNHAEINLKVWYDIFTLDA